MMLLRIDLKNILRSRITGWKGKLIPDFMMSALERIIHQRELNEILVTTYPRQGTDFCDGVYDYLEAGLTTSGMENIPKQGRFIFASNHPLGGLDGIGLIKILGRKYGDENVRFLVNDMLMNVEPLRNVFLPINKYGSQAKAATSCINEAYHSDRQILIFPAGLCSRLQSDGEVRDLKWQKSFISKAVESGRDIIPVFFEGLNDSGFYRIAHFRKKLGIAVNIEQIFLPSQVFKSRKKKFTIHFGKPIQTNDVRGLGKSATEIAGLMHDYVYDVVRMEADIPFIQYCNDRDAHRI